MKPFASVKKKKKMPNITLHTVVIINRDVLPKMSLIVISTGTCIPTLKSPSGPSTKMWYEALCYMYLWVIIIFWLWFTHVWGF